MPLRKRGHFLWRTSKARREGSTHLFPSTLDDLISTDHVCRVIEAFVDKLPMEKLGVGAH